MFKFSVNPVTGNLETTFNGRLVSISDTPKENTNGKQYRNATVEFTNADGVVKNAGCIVYESNFNYGMKIGNEYLCTATKTEQGVLITCSHLVGAARATSDDFGFDTAQVETLVGATNGEA